MPFQAAIRVDMPRISRISGSTRHARPAQLSVMMTSATMAPTMRKMPRPRANSTRGRLPLQMAQRMKLGCAWRRSVYSTVLAISLNADGCVVYSSALSTACRSRPDRFRQRLESSAMYTAMMREISSRYGWILTIAVLDWYA
jgi:hypothetical protein